MRAVLGAVPWRPLGVEAAHGARIRTVEHLCFVVQESWHVLRGYELRVSRPHEGLIHKAAPCRHGSRVVVERVRCRAKNPVRCLQRPEHFQPAAAFDLGELHALSPNKLFVEANWGRSSTEKGDTLRDRKRVPMVLHIVS